MRRNFFLYLTAFIIIGLFACNGTTSSGGAIKDSSATASAATMYYGGDIITMEGDSAMYADAVVVKDGKIAYVGSKD